MSKSNFDTHLAYVALVNAGFDDKKANQIVETIKDSQTDLAKSADTDKISLKINGLYFLYALQMGGAWLDE